MQVFQTQAEWEILHPVSFGVMALVEGNNKGVILFEVSFFCRLNEWLVLCRRCV